jgi:2-iminobutanoate/2-iminopropanoate deaminase
MKKPPLGGIKSLWLGRLDSNQGMQDPKSCALPTWLRPKTRTYNIANVLWSVKAIFWERAGFSGRIAKIKEGGAEKMKKEIKTGKAPSAIGPYSQAVKYGKLLFLSGQIPILPESGKLAEGIEEQTRQALANVEAVLLEAGSSPKNLLEVTIFLADLSHFNIVNELYGEWLGDCIKPARAVVEVSGLPKGALIEVSAKAFVE